MRKHILEQMKVDEYLGHVEEAGYTLHTHNIDPSHLSLANAAALAGTTTDEVLAVMEYRLRHAASHVETPSLETEEAEWVV